MTISQFITIKLRLLHDYLLFKTRQGNQLHHRFSFAIAPVGSSDGGMGWTSLKFGRVSDSTSVLSG